MKPKIFIGPMSLNVVDAVIACANERQVPLGIIPSRRQVDYLGGYVAKWNTSSLSTYIKDKTSLVVLERDHGGPMQGQNNDLGYDSFKADTAYMDVVHIDPWKTVSTVLEGVDLTVNYLKFCYDQNPELKYEVGTEEAIFRYEAEDLDYLLNTIKQEMPHVADKIVYAVVQSGTAIQKTKNIGKFSGKRLQDMTQVCHKYGVQSKEHNGDYLTVDEIKERFDLGLSAINIAPEFGVTETRVILDHIRKLKNEKLFLKLYDYCEENYMRWKKWYPDGHSHRYRQRKVWLQKIEKPYLNEEMCELIEVCGHYFFSDDLVFKSVIDELSKQSPDLQEDIQKTLKNKINKLIDL